jgi:alkanesulfonate monooxygenase SsuD/methylene tetrahydromethanopterin reductase-like flavin-dependent oxidoreductase (luciferase family)
MPAARQGRTPRFCPRRPCRGCPTLGRPSGRYGERQARRHGRLIAALRPYGDNTTPVADAVRRAAADFGIDPAGLSFDRLAELVMVAAEAKAEALQDPRSIFLDAVACELLRWADAWCARFGNCGQLVYRILNDKDPRSSNRSTPHRPEPRD